MEVKSLRILPVHRVSEENNFQFDAFVNAILGKINATIEFYLCIKIFCNIFYFIVKAYKNDC